MRAVCYSSAPAAAWNQTPARTLAWPSIRLKLMAVAVATILAAGFRVGALSTYGLSEDELNKVHALEQYRAGHFSDNAEHPMLMKLAMWASSGTATAWNRIVSPDRAVSLETAIRLPNALAGAATTIVLFGVADLLFGGAVAVVVSLIWAFDVNAIAINRIGKEDTFLLLFFLTAVFCYERAKRTGTTNLGSARTWYTLSGAAFGLMLASKYMPHFLGIYAVFNVLGDRRPGVNKPDRLPHYAAMAAAFLTANPAILLPDTWRYLITYVRGDTLAHHGYLYAGALYVSDVPISPIGVPPGYYLRLLSTRVPMVVLAALLPGAIELVRRRRERGFALLRVLLVFLLVPYSLMAAKFLRYSLPMLATVDVIAAVGLVSGVTWLLRKQWLARTTRVGVASAAAAVFAGGLVAAPQTAAPFYSLFQNAIGERLDPGGAAFPEQTYDYGVRESMAAIAVVAKPRAVIITDAPAVASHYLRIDGRPDVAVRSLSAAGTASGAHEAWIVVQSEHATFENEPVVERLRARETPWTEIRMAGVVAVQVFRREGKVGMRPDAPRLSIVVPLFNERGTLDELHRRLTAVLFAIGTRAEIVYVDDGSTDGTADAVARIAAGYTHVRLIALARNYGQTAALAAGFDAARGDVIVAMDGDLQHVPEEIPKLLAKLNEGYDIVSGWREQRVDGLWTRRLPSRIANWLMAKLSGVPLHDFGTTFKAYRAPVIKRIRLYGDLHRFIPALASRDGARIAEVPIANIPRPQNHSHYGLSRTWRVAADLITVRFLLRYVTRPLHLFGPIGLGSVAAGALGGGWVVAAKIATGAPVFLAHGPLLLLSAVLVQTGIVLIGLGLLAELLTRIYLDGRHRRIYTLAHPGEARAADAWSGPQRVRVPRRREALQ